MTHARPCRCGICRAAPYSRPLLLALSILIAVTACAADSPDDDGSIRNDDGAPALSVVTEPLLAFAWPETVEVRPQVVSYSFVTWTGGPYAWTLAAGAGTTPGSGATYLGPSTADVNLQAHVTTSSCTRRADKTGWDCGTAFVQCPFIDWHLMPEQAYYTDHMGQYPSPGWHNIPPWSPGFHVSFGGDGKWTTADVQSGSPGNITLNCSRPGGGNYLIYVMN